MSRLSASRLLSRSVAHVLVVSLVAFTAAVGVAQSRTQARERGYAGFFDLISTARAGAPPSSGPQEPVTFTLIPSRDGEPQLFSRNMPAALPTPSPLPTPVPVDPDATPLPGPASVARTAIGSTVRAVTPAVVAPVGRALAWPVPGGVISQYFHAGHLALDIAASAGSTVVASEAGAVTWAGWRNNGGGLVVSIDHGNGMVTLYNHLGSIWVGVGQAVARGQAIAAVGCTGMCTGPHVHFEVVVNGVIQNPLRFL